MTRQHLAARGAGRIADELRLERLQREMALPVAPAGGWVEHDPVPVDVIHARNSASAVAPRALRVECVEHAAAPDVPCWGSTASRVAGICRDRLARRSSAVAS
ncbi:hypothetical protein AXH82_01840 [Microbacterium sp. PAMC 28756]|uniref:hypothetical protein n=1 Tax=Microbacterium sp. PAMC 28756 TaxID=1795053 RepID=UPI00076B2581|nr:hypothetical protein [Microbacterium sp. PAMC 28756]AMG82255.1 hypothetical protein AXH82_01840 [Microbacterium sp. PAMC 28756]